LSLLSGRQANASPLTSPPTSDFNFNYPYHPEERDPFSSQLPTPAFASASFGQQQQQPQQQQPQQQQEKPPYEVDVTTERQLFINDVQARKDTSVSSFNTFVPPQVHAGLSNIPEGEWIPQPSTLLPTPYSTDETALAPVPAPAPSNVQSEPHSDAIVIDNDGPLLHHFIDNVLRLFFPIVEARQGGGHERAQAILDSLENNQSYFHCCLSVAATHLKGTIKIKGERINSDILRHRFEAVSSLCASLHADKQHDRILEATLAMIFFHCSVCSPDEQLPDIAWFDHFQAAINLLKRLDLLNVTSKIDHFNPPFSVTLSTWIDILGATMLGRSPHFAHTYRVKHLSGAPSGLCEIMGCEDRVMYLISEIACLDALKLDGTVNGMSVCTHVAALGRQLDSSEPRNKKLEHPYDPANGALRPEKLVKTITTIFRYAARIYLCSLVPGFDRHQESNKNLVEAATRALHYLPDGPHGYDRTIVWPLLIIGTYSVPTSSIRLIMHRRVIEMGENTDFGSWGRLYCVLLEIWRLSDGQLTPVSGRSPTVTAGTQIMRQTKPQNVHWRDVMEKNNWAYLII
jgi:C6 transcription factor Pro1